VWRLRLSWVRSVLPAAVQGACDDEDADDYYDEGPEVKFYAIGLQKETQSDKHDDCAYYDAYYHVAVGQAEAFVFHFAVVFSVASRVTFADSVEGGAAVSAMNVSVRVLSATSATINHTCSPQFRRGNDLVLRFAVTKDSPRANNSSKGH